MILNSRLHFAISGINVSSRVVFSYDCEGNLITARIAGLDILPHVSPMTRVTIELDANIELQAFHNSDAY
jgi:hypothetical protein